jgi:hypothetical protein
LTCNVFYFNRDCPLFYGLFCAHHVTERRWCVLVFCVTICPFITRHLQLSIRQKWTAIARIETGDASRVCCLSAAAEGAFADDAMQLLRTICTGTYHVPADRSLRPYMVATAVTPVAQNVDGSCSIAVQARHFVHRDRDSGLFDGNPSWNQCEAIDLICRAGSVGGSGRSTILCTSLALVSISCIRPELSPILAPQVISYILLVVAVSVLSL